MQGKVSRKIIQDAEKEASNILEQAKKKADEILKSAQKKAQRIKEEAEKSGEGMKKREEERLVTIEKLEEKKMLLTMKREVLNRVFEEALEDMKNWKVQRYTDFIVKKIILAISTGNELVVPGRLHSNALRKQLDKIKRDRNLKFEVAKEDGDFDFGFVIKRERTEVKFTGEDILDELRDRIEIEVARRLFAGDTDKTA